MVVHIAGITYWLSDSLSEAFALVSAAVHSLVCLYVLQTTTRKMFIVSNFEALVAF